MPDNFDIAMVHLLKAEGGFVNDPSDPGKATKYGITAATLARWRDVKSVTADDVKALTADEAREIFHAWYWLPLSCDKLTQSLTSTVLLDAAGLFGVGVAALYAQKAVADSGGAPLTLDGHLGPASVTALNALDPKVFAAAYRNLFLTRIGAIIKKRPASTKFRRGWEKRVDRYVTLQNQFSEVTQ